jgi:hypothetical protein
MPEDYHLVSDIDMRSIKPNIAVVFILLCSCMIFSSCNSDMATVAQHSKAKPILMSIRDKFQGQIGIDSPTTDNLAPIYPNPFNSGLGDTAIHISFTNQQQAAVRLIIQTPIGDSVAIFQDEILSPGTYTGSFPLRNSENELLDEGLYFITLRIEDRGFIDSRLFLIEAN